MIRNWYNQIPHPALKTKREITKYINWRQFTKGTRGKPNEQLLKWVGHSASLDKIKYNAEGNADSPRVATKSCNKQTL